MKKKKPKNSGRKEATEYKPWMLKNISPKARKMAKDCAREQNWKVGDWVEYAILKTSQGEGGESGEEGEGTIDAETFSEMMERLPDKEFMKGWFVGLRAKLMSFPKRLMEPMSLRLSVSRGGLFDEAHQSMNGLKILGGMVSFCPSRLMKKLEATCKGLGWTRQGCGQLPWGESHLTGVFWLIPPCFPS